MKMIKLAVALAMTCGFAGSAHAAAVIKFEQQGTSVVATLTGSIDLGSGDPNAGFTSSFENGSVEASTGTFVFFPTAGTMTEYAVTSTPTTFGTGENYFADSATGINFYLNKEKLFIQSSYESKTVLAASMTFNDTSLSTLGLNTANSVYTLASGDTITVLGVTTAVPEPATWAMLLVGFGMIGATSRYRRRSTRVSLA
jgi:hypothetical protein